MTEWSQRADQQGYYKNTNLFAFNQVSASLFHCCVDMHIPNNPLCFPHTTTDIKHDFTNSNERKHSYVWNLMHNSVPHICKTDSFQNVWKKILMSCCSPSVKVNTHTKKMLWTLVHSWLRRQYHSRRENDQVISGLGSTEIIHIEPTSLILHFKQ
jgi:hypothetical protein